VICLPNPQIAHTTKGPGTFSWTDGERHCKPLPGRTSIAGGLIYESPIWQSALKNPEAEYLRCVRAGFHSIAKRIKKELL
jgi:hypothetical protein